MTTLNSLKLKKHISTHRDGRIHVDSHWRPTGVTKQFLENAETYHARYTDNDHWKYLVGRALDLAGVERQASLKILDIGSGSGNTVFAATDLLPNSVVYANDISPQLLKILVGIQQQIPHLEGRIEAYCFDLHKDFFADNIFDLVIGGSILHHMLDPTAALVNTARWLRPGGKICLFEPMEISAHIMTAIYLTLLAELEFDLHPRIVKFFKGLCHDYEARFGVPRVKSWTSGLDDKWLFHPTYLREMAGKINMTLELVAPTGTVGLEKLFSDVVRSTLNIGGLGSLSTPDKLWELLATFDVGISQTLKERFTSEGIIILAKPLA
jgi:SAM-dependent methyltransferase